MFGFGRLSFSIIWSEEAVVALEVPVFSVQRNKRLRRQVPLLFAGERSSENSCTM
jgi:hypothetical protein